MNNNYRVKAVSYVTFTEDAIYDLRGEGEDFQPLDNLCNGT